VQRAVARAHRRKHNYTMLKFIAALAISETVFAAPARETLFAATGDQAERDSYSARKAFSQDRGGRLLPDELADMTDGKMRKLYERWCERYRSGKACEEGRFGNFKAALQAIAEGNARHFAAGSSVVLGLTALCDRSQQELKALVPTEGRQPDERRLAEEPDGRQLQQMGDLSDVGVRKIDWRERGAVTPMRDQGQCGACWAFSAVSVLEGYEAIVNGQLVTLSEEQVKDCSYQGQSGCSGGWEDAGFEYVSKYGGVFHEEVMPYFDCDDHARRRGMQWIGDVSEDCYNANFDAGSFYDRCDDDKASLWNEELYATDIPSPVYFDRDWNKAIQLGPFAQSWMKVTNDWFYYVSGVMDTDFCDKAPSSGAHATSCVGYEPDGDYFICKNSWGTGWGEEGYFRVRMGACDSTGYWRYTVGLIEELQYTQAPATAQDEVKAPTPTWKDILKKKIRQLLGIAAA